jgi:uncharacterized protein YqhQ
LLDLDEQNESSKNDEEKKDIEFDTTQNKNIEDVSFLEIPYSCIFTIVFAQAFKINTSIFFNWKFASFSTFEGFFNFVVALSLIWLMIRTTIFSLVFNK